MHLGHAFRSRSIYRTVGDISRYFKAMQRDNLVKDKEKWGRRIIFSEYRPAKRSPAKRSDTI